jgi:hypothetical protein
VLEHLLADRVAMGWLSLSVPEGTYHPALEWEPSQHVKITGIVT